MKSSKGISISVRNRLYLNLFNLIFFLIVAFTGLLIQIRYHMHGLNEAYQVAGFDKAAWSLLHKISSVIFFAGLVLHFLANWRFVATSTWRIFSGKFKPLASNSYWLFLISAPSCLTAIMSWALFEGEDRARLVLVETHDKLGWLLIILGFIHLISRSGRMVTSCRKPEPGRRQ